MTFFSQNRLQRNLDLAPTTKIIYVYLFRVHVLRKPQN